MLSPIAVEGTLTEWLNPVEPLVMRIQSLLVWENPRRSAVLVVAIHLLFWVVSRCCIPIYSVASVALMAILVVDTWKKKIWPEIRVPPPYQEDTDGWTPVHPRLLSVPEIARHLSSAICFMSRMSHAARILRRDKPFVFFLLFSSMFIFVAALGMYLSGFMIVYTIVMSAMVWPSLVYHNLLKRAYLRMEPAFMWLDYQLKNKCRFSFGGRQRAPRQTNLTTSSLSGGPAGLDGRPGMLAQVVEEVEEEEEEFDPSLDPLTTAALARAITDSEDEGTNGTPSIPNLSKEPSIDNSDDERRMEDFSLDVDAMPSFDDLDHSDDDLTPVTHAPSAVRRVGSAGDMTFSHSHFDDSDSDEESNMGGDLSFPDVAQTVLSSNTDSAAAVLTSTLVTKTLSSMMESALQGVMGIASGHQAQSSGRLPHTGTKITYTKTSEGESMDFATPEPTITEDEEGCEPSDEDDEMDHMLDDTINNDVAEIEKDFDFLDDLEGERGSPTTPQ